MTRTRHVCCSIIFLCTCRLYRLEWSNLFVSSLSVGEQDCVIPDTCEWSLSNDVGTLERVDGTENTYTAPTGLVNCESQKTEIQLVCADGDGESFDDQAEVTIACSDEIDDNNPSYWTASGGGCNSPSYALILPFFFLFRKRRHD